MNNTQIVRLITLNIGNPSIKRVRKQIEWIEKKDFDILILTETKLSEGCKYLEDFFGSVGQTLLDWEKEPKYNVFFPKSKTGDLGVMILSKYQIINKFTCFSEDNIFHSRIIDVHLSINNKILGIIGLYVPSRDASKEKIQRKKMFASGCYKYLETKKSQKLYIVCGDLNVLERNHYPRYSKFLDWEYRFYESFNKLGYIDAFRMIEPNLNDYSWVGRTGDGYRYDHCFVTNDLLNKVISCHYMHETRQTDKITDHSALFLEFEI